MLVKELKTSLNEVYVRISVDEEVGCVIDTWDGAFGTQENFRNGVKTVVSVLKEKKYNKWLADLSKMKGSWDSSRDWMAKELLPEAIKAGLKWEAVIIPTDVFSKLSTKDTIMKLGGYELRQFDDYGKAIDWLKSVQ